MKATIYSFPRPVKQVAVVGAGPAGLIVGKNLSQEKEFEVRIFERNADIGGVWDYSDAEGPPIQYPQVSARDYDTHCESIPSAVYKSLHTNLYHDLMEVHGLKFPKDVDTYPSHSEVLDYLRAYSEKYHLTNMISRNTTVSSAKWVSDSAQWSLELTTKKGDEITIRTETCDALVVANGHHIVPFVPKITGLQETFAQYPKLFLHSREYKDAHPFRNKSVLLVGSLHSAVDIAHDLAKQPDITVDISIRDMPKRPLRDFKAFNPKITCRPEISHFIAESQKIYFMDGSCIPFPDHILFATGYLYSYPFFRNNIHESPKEEDVTDGNCVKSLYKHLFYAHNPTLCFVALQNIASPFFIADYQGKVIAKVFSGKATLPQEAEMLAGYLKDVEGRPGSSYHDFGLGQIDYCEELSNWTNNAIPPPPEQWKKRMLQLNDEILTNLGFNVSATTNV